MDLEPKSKYVTKKSKIGKKRSHTVKTKGDDTITEQNMSIIVEIDLSSDGGRSRDDNLNSVATELRETQISSNDDLMFLDNCIENKRLRTSE